MERMNRQQQLLHTLSIICKIMKPPDASCPYYCDYEAFDKTAHMQLLTFLLHLDLYMICFYHVAMLNIFNLVVLFPPEIIGGVCSLVS